MKTIMNLNLINDDELDDYYCFEIWFVIFEIGDTYLIDDGFGNTGWAGKENMRKDIKGNLYIKKEIYKNFEEKL